MRTFKYVAFISGLLVVLAIGGYFIFKEEFSGSGEIMKAAREVKENENQKETVTTKGDDEANEQGMTEEEVQQHLHEMSHGKVVADKKWGAATPITMENIENLIAIVEANNYEHEDFYLKHLNEWKNGNFTGAVELHNRIWSWHGGTIGKATGLMTEEEERRYIKVNFGE
jgi:hypothetical protein